MKKTLAAAGLVSAAALAAMYLAGRPASLERRVVLITGGSRGLGLALARECRAQGALLFLVARDEDELAKARDTLLLDGAGEKALRTCVADVRDAGQMQGAVAKATAAFGKVDTVINNAGVIMVGPAETFTLDDYADAMQTNYFGALHITLAVLPQMLSRGDGQIVNIGSIGGKVAFPHLLPYVASKFALVGWSTGLQAELASKGIQVTTVNPGLMATGSHIQALFKGDKPAEYEWFAAAANTPVTATAAGAAARKIVKGMLRGSAEIEVGLDAVLAARLVNVSPAATAAALQLANAMLPEAPDSGAGRTVTRGAELQEATPGVLKGTSERNLAEHNQS